MKILFFIIVLFLTWQIAQGIYNCGEYAGQRQQYRYYKAFYEYKQGNGYVQLHQHTGGYFNPFCKEVLNPFIYLFE